NRVGTPRPHCPECGDSQSLKACSLASFLLRSSSQRLLLSRLTLGLGHTRNHLEAWTLLTESPHLVGYVTELEIYLPMDPMTDREIGCLQRMLIALGRVQRFRLEGVRWDLLDPSISSDLVAFVLRQNLRALSIEGFVLIQAAVVQRFITSVPTLSFDSGGFDPTVDAVPDVPQPRACWFEHLIVRGPGIPSSLCRPEFAAHISKLRRLSVVPADSMGLVHAAVYTLEDLFLALEEGYHSRSVRRFPLSHAFNPSLGLHRDNTVHHAACACEGEPCDRAPPFAHTGVVGRDAWMDDAVHSGLPSW
ncbi:hypothetical protein DFH09DRAFT_1468142, partial [Mycena vulgaris]